MTAFEFAQRAHAGSYRADGVTPYFYHPQAVALWVAFAGGDEVALSVALLHDVVEDCAVGVDELSELFGADVALPVSELSLPAGVPNRKRLQLERAPKLSPIAKLVKLADILANLSDLERSGWSADRARKYFDHLCAMRQALAGTSELLEQEFDAQAALVSAWLQHKD